MSNVQSKLVSNFERRIEKRLSASRPIVPIPGTNHSDDYSLWSDDTIYKGELGINFTNGTVWTHDGQTPVQLNSEDSILEGLEISTSGVSSQYISISSGKFRQNGKIFKHVSPVDVTDTGAVVLSNSSTFPRIDILVAAPDYTIYHEDELLYGIKFEILQGTPAEDPDPIDCPDGWVLLGMVYVYPNNLPNGTLYPITHSESDYSTFPLQVIESKDFVKNRQRKNYVWSTNLLLFRNQIFRYNDKLYYAVITHQSTDIISDDADGKIRDLCCGSGGGGGLVERFSDIGLYPTDGTFSDGYFPWTASTRILNAFDDINELLLKLAPVAPDLIQDTTMSITTANFTARAHTTGSILSTIIDDTLFPEAETDVAFRSFETGSIVGFFDATNTSSIPVTVTSHPPDSTFNASGTGVSISLNKFDPYEGEVGRGFFNAFTGTVENTVNVSGSLTLRTLGIRYSDDTAEESSATFYTETLSTPAITSVTDIKGVWSGKWVSGVPVLQADDIVKSTYNVSGAVGYFFNQTKVSRVSSTYLDTADYAYTSPFLTDSIPYTALSQVLHFVDAEAYVKDLSYTRNLDFDIYGYNARGDSGIYNTGDTGILIDDASQETGVRRKAGIGTYPGAGTWGSIYTSSDSSTTLSTAGNEELQLLGGDYFYPTENFDFSGAMVNTIGTPISGPNYSGIVTPIRWALFKIGNIEDARYVRFRLNDATGITEDWSDGITMSNDFYLQLKVDGTDSTGWLDVNKAYSTGEPLVDGDASLDASGSTITLRRATFGTEGRTGDVYVRVGIPYGSAIRFRGVTMLSNDDLFEGDTWDTYEFDTYENIKSVKFELVGATGIDEDFSPGSPMTMTDGLDIELRLDSESPYGTDWVDANEAYSIGNPFNYGDAALDVANSTPTIRRITFGKTPRTGILKIRIRLGVGQTISSINIIEAI